MLQVAALISLLLVLAVSSVCLADSHGGGMDARFKYQFDTAEIVMFGSDHTDWPEVEYCNENGTDCQTNGTYVAPRRHMKFNVMCVLRDGGWSHTLLETIMIGDVRNASDDDVTQFDHEEPDLFYVFVKRSKEGDQVTYDWSEDMGVPGVYTGHYNANMGCNLATITGRDCELNELKPKRCDYECPSGWFGHHDKCYRLTEETGSKADITETCDSWDADLAHLNMMSYKTVKDWLIDGEMYWVQNTYYGSQPANTPVPWNNTMMTPPANPSADNMLAVTIGNMGVYPMANDNTEAMAVCSKDAMHRMSYYVENNRATKYDYTFSTTGQVYGRCCQRPSAVKPSSVDVNFDNQGTGNMTMASAEYMKRIQVQDLISVPQGNTHLAVMFESSGRHSEMGSQDNPYIMAMVMISGDETEEIFSYQPLLPMSMMPLVYHLRVYDVTEKDMSDLTAEHIYMMYAMQSSMMARDNNCSRCFFHIRQFEEDYQLTAATSLTWLVTFDLSTAETLYQSGNLMGGGEICEALYPHVEPPYHPGVYVCDSPVAGAATYRVLVELVVFTLAIVFII